MGVKLVSSSGGSVEVNPPTTASNFTQTLVETTGTLAPIVSGTAVASTSGTSIDFTGIPSWAKRITVMFNGVSTSGSSNILIQIGSGSVTTSGYASQAWTTTGGGVVTTGLIATFSGPATNTNSGVIVLSLITSNTWVSLGLLTYTNTTSVGVQSAGNSPALSGTLDRVRITTVNGTDTFDAGSINILYE